MIVMRQRTLGSTGLDISQCILGTVQFGWTADEQTSFALMDTFLDAGGTTLDTADIYTTWDPASRGGISEEIIGRWMKERGNRHDVMIATKGRGRMWDGPDGEGLSRAHLTRAVEDSLHRLQTDYIDLYQTHWDDLDTPFEETLGVLDEMVKAGKIRCIGCSNIPAARLRESLLVSEKENLVRYQSLQPHYNLAHRAEFEAELCQLCTEHTIAVLPYSPLAGGFLTGKYRRDTPPPVSARAGSVQERYGNEYGWRIIETLETIAGKMGCSIAQLALAWVMIQPSVTAPILGANRVDHLIEHLGALELTILPEDLELLDHVSSATNRASEH